MLRPIVTSFGCYDDPLYIGQVVSMAPSEGSGGVIISNKSRKGDIRGDKMKGIIYPMLRA